MSSTNQLFHSLILTLMGYAPLTHSLSQMLRNYHSDLAAIERRAQYEEAAFLTTRLHGAWRFLTAVSTLQQKMENRGPSS